MANKKDIGPIVTAVIVAVIELGALFAGMDGEPLDLVEGWRSTRELDAIGIVLAVIGCGSLFGIARYPTASTLIASLSYSLFILRDYEFGMTLPAMVAIYIIVVRNRQLVTAILSAVGCLAASSVWIAQRASTIEDGGVATLVWVAFGTVTIAFFFGPLIAGELVSTRRKLRAVSGMAASEPPGSAAS